MLFTKNDLAVIYKQHERRDQVIVKKVLLRSLKIKRALSELQIS